MLYIPKQKWAEITQAGPGKIAKAKELDEADEYNGELEYLKDKICDGYGAEFVDLRQGNEFSCTKCGEKTPLLFYVYGQMLRVTIDPKEAEPLEEIGLGVHRSDRGILYEMKNILEDFKQTEQKVEEGTI